MFAKIRNFFGRNEAINRRLDQIKSEGINNSHYAAYAARVRAARRMDSRLARLRHAA